MTAFVPWRIAAPLLVMLMLTSGCTPPQEQDEAPADAAHPLAAELAALLAAEPAGTPALPGAMLRVEAPTIALRWSGAAGVSDLGTTTPLDPGQTLRIASITKTFVAAAVLRLAEQGRLDLDEPIARHLLPATRAVLRNGGYPPDVITVRMLLAHTSGLYDYATSDAFFARVIAEPGHRWSRNEQLQLAMTAGSRYGEPGAVFRYSDTGYILLGEVLEMVTDRDMPVTVRELLDLDGLGLEHTWFETLEPEPGDAPDRAHQYQDGTDATGIDASVDLYGGGGLVSTLPDLTRFFRALVGGRVFEREETLAAMLAASPQSTADSGDGYGLGLARHRVGALDCYGHGGYWGIVVWHCPAVDVTAAAAVTDTSADQALARLQRNAVTLAADAAAAAGP